jgi:hypothetical protein
MLTSLTAASTPPHVGLWHGIGAPQPTRSPTLVLLEQRMLASRNLWAGQQCMQAVIDMGELGNALTTEIPGFTTAFLSKFPCMARMADAMLRGCFVAEVVGQLACELQRPGDEIKAPRVSTVHGRDGRVTIIFPCHSADAAMQAIVDALAAVDTLAADTTATDSMAPHWTVHRTGIDAGRFHADSTSWQRQRHLHQRPPATDMAML